MHFMKVPLHKIPSCSMLCIEQLLNQTVVHRCKCSGLVALRAKETRPLAVQIKPVIVYVSSLALVFFQFFVWLHLHCILLLSRRPPVALNMFMYLWNCSPAWHCCNSRFSPEFTKTLSMSTYLTQACIPYRNLPECRRLTETLQPLPSAARELTVVVI